MDLQAIEARLAAATPGPWSRSGHDVGQVVYGPGGQPDLIGPISTNSDIEDAEFIAHAPEDIRALIDVVKAVKRIHAPEVVQVSTADESMIDLCWCCKEPHPCDTARALGVKE